MKFNLKTLVAAVALAAVAGQAAAALPEPTTATGTSDLIFFAFDIGGNKAFTFDLGAVSNLTSLNQNITGNSAWTSYFAAEGNSLANTTWGIAYNQGNNGASSVLGTTATVDSFIDVQDGSAISGGRVAFNNFLGATSMTGVGTAAYDNTFNFSNYLTGLGNNFGGNAQGYTVDNAVGTAADFYTVTANGGHLVASGFTFDGFTVAAQVVAVPEPETYSMLFAGLMMIGAIARRRKV